MCKNLLYLLFIVFAFASCQDEKVESKNEIDRPHEPFVFRSVLDKNPRMVTAALSENLWVAYHTESCALYKAWKGMVNFDGPVYTNVHGPQPTTVGDAFMENDVKDVWTLLDGDGNIIPSQIEYVGHRLIDGGVELMYEIPIKGQIEPIKIYEKPESRQDGVQTVFERSFKTENIPEDYVVHFKFNVNSIPTKENIETDGAMKVLEEKENQYGNITALEVFGDLALNSNGSTYLNTKFVKNPVLVNPLNQEIDEIIEDGTTAPLGLSLINENDCKTCHNKNVKTIGPAYRSIAERYRTNEDNIKLLIRKVQEGGTGKWGNQIMNAHPELSTADARAMIAYILSLDSDEGEEEENTETFKLEPSDKVKISELIPGLVTSVYLVSPMTPTMPKISENKRPKFAGIMANYDNISGDDFKGLDDDFALIGKGYIVIEKAQNYIFRIWSDDGSLFYINGEKILDNDGPHGVVYKEKTLFLKEGVYPIRVEYMQGVGGKFLSLNWKPEDKDAFEVIPEKNLMHHFDQQKFFANNSLPMASISNVPGDMSKLQDVHPSFTLKQARPDDFQPRVGGIDFLSDGRMVVSTWDPSGAIYILENHESGDPESITVKKIASGLAEPLGLVIKDDRIFVMQKQEITELIDNNDDDIIDEYRTVADDWGVSGNFHEFGFGLEEKDGYLYAALATAIEPGGASTQPQIKDRGKVIKVNMNTGALEFIAHGLRTPNGVGLGYDDDIYVTDNQGDWLPASKVMLVKEGAFLGSRSVDYEGTEGVEPLPPIVWLPQDEIGNSPSTPLKLNVGPYKNQMIHGEVTHGGVKRVFVEEIDGVRQGALFRFIQGLEAGVNRMRWHPDGSLYVGGIGSTGNWQQTGKLWHGLQRLEFNGNPTFEMLAVRAMSNGLEIEFTEPLTPGDGWKTSAYDVQQWYYQPTVEYGGPKMDHKTLRVRSATVSEDRKKVFLQVDGIKEGHVVYIRLADRFVSEADRSLWSTECWYTMNKIPKDRKGKVSSPPFVMRDNSLTPYEKENGWELLFDGRKIDKFRNFKKETIGKSWIVKDNAIHLNSVKKDDGGWQAADGGDIITLEAYEDFEFKIDWKISTCGNSGIIFNVVESDDYNYVWETGPEMQILDNTCHPDTRFKTHRAGDLYDMIETKFNTVNPAGQWNHVRIVSKDGKVDFWLNGYKVVEFEMHTEEWKEMIANSKFKDMSGFGMSKEGHIALQDHGDKVWFKNIKIKRL